MDHLKIYDESKLPEFHWACPRCGSTGQVDRDISEVITTYEELEELLNVSI